MADAETSLVAKFELIDSMSDKLESIASRGDELCDKISSIGDLSEQAFSSMESSAETAGSSMDSAAQSAESMQSAMQKAADSASSLEDAAGRAGSAISGAADDTDYWTDAAGNYNKSALEAVYSTEELVNMGLKSSDALQEEAANLQVDQEAFDHLTAAIDATDDIQQQLTNTIEQADDVLSRATDTKDQAAISTDELTQAMQEAENASDQLADAQRQADEAQQNYNDTVETGTTNMDDLEQAASKAEEAAENLASANENAANATSKLSSASKDTEEKLKDLKKESDDTGDAMKTAGSEGSDAFSTLAAVIASYGIEDKITDIAESVYDLADSYSEASKIIVNATGATGDALDSLDTSALDAFSQNDDDLNSTAATVGELNTRLGLTGDQLTETTQDFMDFADVTNSDGVSSVQNVTKIMNRYNMSASEMGDLMDDLVYAGQESGASVDAMSQALITGASAFQSVGMEAENAINFLSQMELQGVSSTQTITALNKATVYFSEQGIDASEGLQQVIESIATMGDEAEATSLATEVFGSRVGVTMANAIRSGAITVDTLTGSMEEAEGSLESTAEAGESLSEKWQKASNSIKAAFTKNVESPISSASSALAGLVDSFGNFLNEHPTLTKALASLGTGFLTATAAIVGTATVIKLNLIPAIAGFVGSLTAALGPVGLITVGISAATVALATFLTTTEEAVDPEEELTAATQAEQEQLEALTNQYEEACEKYGDTSEQASELRYQMDDLSDSIDSNGQTVGEMKDSYQATLDEYQEYRDQLEENQNATHENELENLALIEKLDDLASSTDTTGGKQKKMEAILNELNGSIDGLNISYEDLINNQDATIDTIKQAAEAQAELNAEQNNYDSYVDALEKQADLESKLEDAKNETAAAQAKVNEEQEKFNKAVDAANQDTLYTGTPGVVDNTALKNAEAELEEAQSEQEGLQQLYDENEQTIEDLEGTFDDLAEKESEAADVQLTDQEAVALAFEDVQQDVYDLAEAYQEAYDSVSSSLDSVFGLFDEFSAEDEAFKDSTVANAQEALDSQLDYWTQYSANIQTIKDTSAQDLGITQENYDALVAMVQDGSEESAGLAASIVANIEQGNTDAVSKLAETAGSVNETKDEISTNIAEWQTDYDATMDELVEKMDQTVDDLNLSDEASASAKSTIDAYAQQIKSSGASAVTEAENIVNQVAQVFNSSSSIKISDENSLIGQAMSSSSGSSTTTVEGNASGTTDSADVFIAGEEGPELVVGKKGSEVFPASETTRIIDAVDRFGGVLSDTYGQTEKYPSVLENPQDGLLRNQAWVSDLTIPAENASEPSDELMLDTEGNDLTALNSNIDAIRSTYDYYMQALETANAMGVDPAAVGNELTDYFYGSNGILTQTMQKMYGYADEVGTTPEDLFSTMASDAAGETYESQPYDIDTLSSAIEGYLADDTESGTMDTSVIPFPEQDAIVTPDGETPTEATITSEPYSEADEAVLASELQSRDSGMLTSPDYDIRQQTSLPQSDSSEGSSSGGEQTKTIRLEINGSGAINIPAGADKNEILQVMQENLKPVLMNLLNDEIYEEGNGTYDY